MKINWLNCWTGGSAVLLIGTEVVGIAAAGAWAVAGLVRSSDFLAVALIALASLGGIAATALFARQVHRTEPFFEIDRHPATHPATLGHDVNLSLTNPV